MIRYFNKVCSIKSRALVIPNDLLSLALGNWNIRLEKFNPKTCERSCSCVKNWLRKKISWEMTTSKPSLAENIYYIYVTAIYLKSHDL